MNEGHSRLSKRVEYNLHNVSLLLIDFRSKGREFRGKNLQMDHYNIITNSFWSTTQNIYISQTRGTSNHGTSLSLSYVHSHTDPNTSIFFVYVVCRLVFLHSPCVDIFIHESGDYKGALQR